jgi:hypothetical protein
MSSPGEPIVIARRFRGPPTSGNGGYCCGLLAERIAGPAEATLRAPPPLEQPLALDQTADDWQLKHAAQLVAEARPAELVLDVPQAPTLAMAVRSAERFAGFTAHLFPECFVCGPARAVGDGLRIFTGPTDDGALVAAPFVAPADLADEAGALRPAFVWAALDCPGYFAAAAGQPALLGRMTGELLARPRAGQRYIVVGWALGSEGRKIHAGTALYDEAGALLGRSRQTWIRVDRV